MATNLEKKILTTAKYVLAAEAKAILSLENAINQDFTACVEAIYQNTGRLVVSGIGKSAIIAQKIVATLNSTGQPAIFMHAADAIHGDLGMIQPSDFVMVLSKSGDTPEIKVLVPLIRRLGNPLIALVSNANSYLAQNANFLLHAPIEREACPLNLAPTTSTTVALALGDALAMALLEVRNFTKEDFAVRHPGGSLGKRLYLKVEDLYKQHGPLPKVGPAASIKEVIFEISSKRLGATAVVNESGNLLGIITDGDLRRMLNNHTDFTNLTAQAIMTAQPKVVEASEYASRALQQMQEQSITQLVVVENDQAVGFIHLHDLLREGIG